MDELRSSVGIQDMNLSGFQLSEPDDVEIYRENAQLVAETVFRRGIDTPFQYTLSVYFKAT